MPSGVAIGPGAEVQLAPTRSRAADAGGGTPGGRPSDASKKPRVAPTATHPALATRSPESYIGPRHFLSKGRRQVCGAISSFIGVRGPQEPTA